MNISEKLPGTAGNNGFTLIEVVVALAVITIGILAVNAMQTASVRGNMTASQVTTASSWAADQAERIFSLDYDDPLLNPVPNADGNRAVQDGDDNGIDNDDVHLGEPGGGDGIVNFGLEQDTVATADFSRVEGDYTILWNIADGVPMPDTKTVYVIVSRNERGTTKTVTIRHLKARYF